MRNCLCTDSSVFDFETVLDTACFPAEQIAASSSRSNKAPCLRFKVKHRKRVEIAHLQE